jgi:Fe-S cluster assembly scaffold protein SufB
MSAERPQLKEVTAAPASLADHARRPLAAAPSSEGITGEALKDLDRIREILYGSEKRDASRRLEQMEQRLESFATRMDTEIQRRMEAFEEQIKEEVRGLAAEISAEQRRSGDLVETMLRQYQGAIEQMEQKIEDQGVHAANGERDLRELVNLQVQSLTELMRRNHDEITAALDRTSRELRSEAVDGLAGALREVAKQVSTRRPSPDVSAPESE